MIKQELLDLPGQATSLLQFSDSCCSPSGCTGAPHLPGVNDLCLCLLPMSFPFVQVLLQSDQESQDVHDG